jgi:ABC-type branched-subunit amino acid transport system substrate-binding protein
MKYKIIATLLITALAVTNVDAQSRREKKRREQERLERLKHAPHPDRRSTERQQERRAEPPKPKKKVFEVEYPRSVTKDVYRIDVLVPLYLDELVKNNKPTYKGKMPDKAALGLDFYQGIQLAADTLESKGYKLEVYVHDIASLGSSIKTLISRGTLDSSDLIIGAIQSADIPEVAERAKKNNINFISALSPSDGGVRNNPYLTLLQPRLQTHCEWIMKKIAEKYHKEQITILYRTSVNSDGNAYTYLTNILEENDLRKMNCNKAPDSLEMAKAFSKDEVNVIIMPIVETAYAESLLRNLYKYFPGYKFAVYGMPSWKSMSSLRKPDAFPNVATYFTAPFYFDPSTSGAQLLYMGYQNRFNGKPSEMTYRGFETLYWYATLLKDYGTIFNDKIKNNDKAPFTKFEIKTNWDKAKEDVLFNENQHLYLYRYQSSSYMLEQ